MLEYSNAPAKLIDTCSKLPGCELEKHLLQHGKSVTLSQIRPALNKLANGEEVECPINTIMCGWTNDLQTFKAYLDAIHECNSLDEIIDEIYVATGLMKPETVMVAAPDWALEMEDATTDDHSTCVVNPDGTTGSPVLIHRKKFEFLKPVSKEISNETPLVLPQLK